MNARVAKEVRKSLRKVTALAIMDERKRVLGLIQNMRDDLEEAIKNKVLTGPAELRLLEVRKEIGQAILFALATEVTTNKMPKLKEEPDNGSEREA